jgi:cytochrome c5
MKETSMDRGLTTNKSRSFSHSRVRALWLAALLSLPALALAAAGGLSGKEVVDTVCAKCHAAGVNGAPRIGDQKNWSKRAAQGLTSLTQHALEGIRRMPSHGGNPNLTDTEISRAITYMVNQSGGHWIEPVAEATAGTERSGEQVVKAQCVKCHQAGLNGAPKIGDRQAWLPRMKRGVDYLVKSAVHGHGGMPARGGEADLSDSELKGAILYMFDPKYTAGAKAVHPATPGGQPSLSDKGPNHAVAGNVEIFLGIVAAESLLSYPSGSAERAMHGGVPKERDAFHLNVSLQDRVSQQPITGARVSVQIEPAGSVGTERTTKALEPIPFGPASYGNYVHFKRNTPYIVTVRVSTPTSAQPVEARFEQTLY